MYDLTLARQIDNMLDYDILFNNTQIGSLNITVKEDSVFIRHIDIFPEHRRRGHARNVLDYMFERFEKDVCFCVATNSESAVNFWNKILAEREHTHISGNIYQLQNPLIFTQKIKQVFS